MRSLYSISRKNLEAFLLQNGYPKYRAIQIFEGLYKQNVSNIDDIKVLKQDFKEFLKGNFYLNQIRLMGKEESVDGTVKYLFSLADNHLIETVLMKHDYGNSVCISTQVGCNFACAFCASGLLKKQRNLKTDELVLQVKYINDDLKKKQEKVSSVVIMGIGEPFDNYDNLLEFLEIVNDSKALEIGSRHITVSTVGLVPQIEKFSTFSLQVNLAVSLHFASDEKRSKYMPVNRAYNLQALKKTLLKYFVKTKRRVTIEYILLKGVNDSIGDAKLLVDFVSGLNCYVNLIPYNQTNSKFERSEEAKVNEFFKYLKKNKVNVTKRREQGHDINAACGQLRNKQIKEV
ncbi:MAG TPA: 23S rRNA (adenine(2503)-C(2))-methyltransferase RlmN [Bacilli bacterium]|nr:23S rRNA (adenine(2503)-C(2))-methyltransferase RlmN [Bacilli bacterium]HOR53278.1 23S rRNA (adenine(2503)-C(2))-methyltransferase RlmN [Bacilli bacterium]